MIDLTSEEQHLVLVLIKLERESQQRRINILRRLSGLTALAEKELEKLDQLITKFEQKVDNREN